MRTIALILLGGAVLMTVGCSSSRSFSRQAVMADHIASVRPDGSRYAPARATAVQQPSHARQVTAYTPVTQARYVPAPPPPPAMPAARSATPVVRQPVARQPVRRAAAQPVRRAATPVRRAAPKRAARARPAAKSSGWKLFGGHCVGGT